MHDYLIGLLRALEQAVPPNTNGHHAIFTAVHGNHGVGHSEKLCLSINDAGRMSVIFLDATDLGRAIPDVVRDVLACVTVARLKAVPV